MMLVLVARGASAAEVVPSVHPPNADATTQAWLDKRMCVWQARLKLESWAIRVVVCDSGDLRPNTLGNIHWDAENKTAIIRLLDSSTGAMERTLVHELVHLALAALPKTDATRMDEEKAVSHMADALLALDPQSEPRVTSSGLLRNPQ
jgi:hypothetical protein